jgi:hypothetical protein
LVENVFVYHIKIIFSHIRQVAKWGFSYSVMLVILLYKLQCKSWYQSFQLMRCHICCPNPIIVANSKHNWENELFHNLKSMEHLLKNLYVDHVVLAKNF